MDYMPMILIIILFTLFNMNISELRRKQKQLESKLDKIIAHLGLDELSSEYISDELKNELIELVRKNEKIKAIKKLREATEMGLKEAKDYVDSL